MATSMSNEHVSFQDSATSSDDDEESQRLQEAAVSADDVYKDHRRTDAPSKAVEAGQQEGRPIKGSLRKSEDCTGENELQTTPEFRTFVAKKLTYLIDQSIEVAASRANPAVSTATDLAEEEDRDFRLFSTSQWRCPAMKCTETRKRPVSSSSDSDTEELERLASAAVDGQVILAQGQVKVMNMAASLEASKNGTTSLDDTFSEKPKKKKHKVKKKKDKSSERSFTKVKKEQSQQNCLETDDSKVAKEDESDGMNKVSSRTQSEDTHTDIFASHKCKDQNRNAKTKKKKHEKREKEVLQHKKQKTDAFNSCTESETLVMDSKIHVPSCDQSKDTHTDILDDHQHVKNKRAKKKKKKVKERETY